MRYSQCPIIESVDSVSVASFGFTFHVQAVECSLELHPVTATPAGQALLFHAFKQTEQLTDEQANRKARGRFVEDLTPELQYASKSEGLMKATMRFKTGMFCSEG